MNARTLVEHDDEDERSGESPSVAAGAGARDGGAPEVGTPGEASGPSVRSRIVSPLPSSGQPRLEKYELLEEIGHGGMATVYRGRDPRLGREVAVKVIHKHLRDNPEVARRFVAEARAAAKLRHPGIVEVYDVSTEEDRERYLVVELIGGTTLRKVLEKHRDMPAEVGAAIALELCAALEHAHGAGIVHRDVKPENVLVELPADRAATTGRGATPPSSDRRGAKGGKRGARAADPHVVVKLTDFGIAKVLDAQGLTSTGQVLGSPAHMAPEQIEGGDVDVRTDVFALGVLLYECLAGHLPFEGKNPAQVLRRVLDGTYVPVDRERPKAGGRWAAIVAGALARDAAARTATPGELGERIRGELAALGVADPRAEIASYFSDPEDYTKRHEARLVPLLVARGEKARRHGDVTGAAADFNRALALSPNDPAILKRVASLGSMTGRRLLARRIAAIAAGSAALGFAAYGIARSLKPVPQLESPAAISSPPDDAVAFPRPPAPVLPVTMQGRPKPNGPHDLPKAAVIRKPASPQLGGSASAAATSAPAGDGVQRKVRFHVNPGGAVLALDGAPQKSWLGRVFPLDPGPHTVDVKPPEGSKCCKPQTKRFTVTAPPSDQPDEETVVKVSLEPEPATVTFSGGPAGGRYDCPLKGLGGRANETKTVKLPEAQWSGKCMFTDPGGEVTEKRVTIRAGEVSSIPWPGS